MVSLLIAVSVTTSSAGGLGAAIDACLQVRAEVEASRQLEAILARADATPEAVLAALHASEGSVAAETELAIPYCNQLLLARVRAPAGHDAGGALPPVVLDVSGGPAAEQLALRDAIVVSPRGYTPPEFSDEGRDAFLKVLRSAAHRMHGDPARLWLIGFAWGGHACFDTALHRPGVLCGIVALCGAPRRVHLRLLDQLRGVTVRALCGAQDDPELVWTLNELKQIAGSRRLTYQLQLDPERGRELALAGADQVAGVIASAPPLSLGLAPSGELIADGALVENPLLRIEAIDEARVKIAHEVSVPAGASEDAKRRLIIKSMEKAVVKLRWKIETRGQVRTLMLESDGVKSCSVLVRAPLADQVDQLVVRARNKVCFAGAPLPDVRAVLTEARRTGDRLTPVLRTIAVSF